MVNYLKLKRVLCVSASEITLDGPHPQQELGRRVSPHLQGRLQAPQLRRALGCCDSLSATEAFVWVQILILRDSTFTPLSLVTCVTHKLGCRVVSEWRPRAGEGPFLT